MTNRHDEQPRIQPTISDIEQDDDFEITVGGIDSLDLFQIAPLVDAHRDVIRGVEVELARGEQPIERVLVSWE